MSEEPIIKRKLVLDGDGMGDDKKILFFLKQVTKWLSTIPDSDSELLYNRILAQLNTIQCMKRKSELLKQSQSKQKDLYSMIHANSQEGIKRIKTDIHKQHILLKKAKIVKQNYMKFDLLVKTVIQRPSRILTGKRIEILKKEIRELECEKENLDQKLEARVKQCHVLSTSANTLKSILKEDNIEWDCEMDTSTNSGTSELDMQVIIL